MTTWDERTDPNSAFTDKTEPSSSWSPGQQVRDILGLNGGFESGDLSYWRSEGLVLVGPSIGDAIEPVIGSYQCFIIGTRYFGMTSHGRLYRDITGATPGKTARLRFLYANKDETPESQDFSVQAVFSGIGTVLLYEQPSGEPEKWTDIEAFFEILASDFYLLFRQNGPGSLQGDIWAHLDGVSLIEGISEYTGRVAPVTPWSGP